MTKTLEDYAKYLTPVPHTIPGLFRWKVGTDSYGYAYLFLQIWKPKRAFWSRKEVPNKGKWYTVQDGMLTSSWDDWDIRTKSERIIGRMRAKFGSANIVMAERGFDMKVKAHLHLPKRKRGEAACISVTPFVHTKGVPTEYAGTLILKNVRFRVSEPGRQRTITNKVKNVHAWVIGDVVYKEDDQLWLEPSLRNRCREASYNPYKNATFVDKETGWPVHSAQTAYMVGHKVYYVPEGQ